MSKSPLKIMVLAGGPDREREVSLKSGATVTASLKAAGHDAPLCEPGETLALVTDADLRHEHLFELGQEARLARFLVERLDLLRRY